MFLRIYRREPDIIKYVNYKLTMFHFSLLLNG